MSKLYDSESILLQDSLSEQLYDSADAPATNINPIINLSGQSKINIKLKGEAKVHIVLNGETETDITLSGNIDEPKE